jgi:hypothetical protein
MSEPAAPHPDPGTTARPPSSPDSTIPPMPYPTRPTARPLSPPDGTIPPMPSEATNAHTHPSAAVGRWRTAMTPLRKMMRRTPPGAA